MDRSTQRLGYGNIARPLKSAWRYRSAGLALAIHAALFLWMFTIRVSPAEKHEIQRHMHGKSLASYAQAIIEQRGLHWLSIILWNGNREVNYYWHLSQLSLKGDASYWKENSGLTLEVRRPWPYRDIPVEYQPMGLLSIIVPALISEDIDEYFFWLATWLCLLYVANLLIGVYLVSDGKPSMSQASRMLWWSVGFLVLFGDIAAARFDHFVVTVMMSAAAIFWLAMKSEGRSGIMWFFIFGCLVALGMMTKIVPCLLLLAAMLVLLIRQGNPFTRVRAISSLVGFATALMVLNAFFYGILGSGYLKSFTYHIKRGIQAESVYAGILMLGRFAGMPVSFEGRYRSLDLVAPHSELIRMISPLLFLGLAGLVSWRVWRTRDSQARSDCTRSSPAFQLMVIAMVLLLAFVITNKVFSPQYMLWIGPFMAILVSVRKEMHMTSWIFLLATLLTQLVFPVLCGPLGHFDLYAIVILNARNFILIAVFSLLLYNLPHYLRESS